MESSSEGWAIFTGLTIPQNKRTKLVALNASTVIRTTYLAELRFKAAWGEILTAGGNFCWKQNIIL